MNVLQALIFSTKMLLENPTKACYSTMIFHGFNHREDFSSEQDSDPPQYFSSIDILEQKVQNCYM